MLKQIAWNTFKNTGNINTFMELLEVDKAIESTNKNEQNKEVISNENRKIEKWEL